MRACRLWASWGDWSGRREEDSGIKISSHTSVDWCHICGKRVGDLADVFYPENAEHGKGESKYIRICSRCADKISKAAFASIKSAFTELATKKIV